MAGPVWPRCDGLACQSARGLDALQDASRGPVTAGIRGGGGSAAVGEVNPQTDSARALRENPWSVMILVSSRNLMRPPPAGGRAERRAHAPDGAGPGGNRLWRSAST